MWHLKNIPKILHLYWGNDNISFMRIMTPISFHKYNPDWKIILHLPKNRTCSSITWSTGEQKGYQGKNYIDELLKLDYIEKNYIDFDEIGFRNDANEVHKSDFLRWYILSSTGGVWSDMDIIYYNTMNHLVFNIPKISELGSSFCICKTNDNNKKLFVIGFLLSTADSVNFSMLYKLAKTNYNPDEYQSIGANLFSDISFNKDEKSINIPEAIVYPLPITDEYKFSLIYKKDISFSVLDKMSIGLHWYAGNPDSNKYENMINDENYKDFKILITKLIEIVMKENNSK